MGPERPAGHEVAGSLTKVFEETIRGSSLQLFPPGYGIGQKPSEAHQATSLTARWATGIQACCSCFD